MKMMNPEVEVHIKNNCSWSRLPQTVKQALGNNEQNWEKSVSDYCIKNQFRFKNSIARQVRKDEKKYYQELIKYSQQHLMLYPYHLSDITVKGLRLTPFSYYCNMLEDIMTSEKSYDSLPNFTAADCLRLLGIGRNQYIEMMNRCKSSKKFFRVKKPPRELFPLKPVPQQSIPKWWVANTGFITDDDVKSCTVVEKAMIDKLIDQGNIPVSELDSEIVQVLYNRGLIYVDVPINEEDYIIVPPLKNFVMNRVLGDYMETILYKVFVSLDERTTVEELSQVLEIDLTLTKNAISLFCRLGLAHKRVDTGGKAATTRPVELTLTKSRKFDSSTSDLLLDFDDADMPLESETEKEVLEMDNESEEAFLSSDMVYNRRIAFLFDSTLTAFLMMGNLSQGLKSHAVTMFEVGKLTDESLDNFLTELKKIENVSDEGEAQRYFDHAVVLKNTIEYVRNNKHLNLEHDDLTAKLDLVRCESMNSLDPNVCARILRKKYNLLISMAPLCNEIRPLSSCDPPHIGPAIPEVNSAWFKLFLYHKVKLGPPSILLVKGSRLRKLPTIFRDFERVLITTWSHDPSVLSTSNLLFSLNEALTHSPVLIQGHGIYGEGEVMHVSFPLDDHYTKESGEQIPSLLQKINSNFDLTCTCGYVTLLNISCKKRTKHSTNSDKSVNNNTIDSKWLPLRLSYGVPLFDNALNKEITSKIVTRGLCGRDSLQKMVDANRLLSLELLHFITEWQEKLSLPSCVGDDQPITHPSKSIMFSDGVLSVWS